MDQTEYYKSLGLTREDDVLDLCPKCGAEHWHPKGRFIDTCDVCGAMIGPPESEE